MSTEEVPQEWKQLGFSGLFSMETVLITTKPHSADKDVPATPEEVDEFESKLPTRVPFHTNSNWLALRVNREVNPPTVVLIRNDNVAVVEAFTRSR